jgi:hypothetical protein
MPSAAGALHRRLKRFSHPCLLEKVSLQGTS